MTEAASGYVDILPVAVFRNANMANIWRIYRAVLMNYHIGSGILPPQKMERNLISGEDSYLEERRNIPSISAETAYLC